MENIAPELTMLIKRTDTYALYTVYLTRKLL